MHKLLASETFAAAPRLRAVLEYLLQALEDGATEEITEQSIGQAVFGRPPGYNASEDNIVRVTIRHLRTRLDEFYRTEGRNEAQALVILKGKYLPTFVPWHGSSARIEQEEVRLADSRLTNLIGESVAEAQRTRPSLAETSLWSPYHWKLRLWSALCVVVILSFGAGYIARIAANRSGPPSGGILARFCHPGENLLVVVVDSNLQTYRFVFGKQVSLEDYINRTYGKQPLDSKDPRVANAMRGATASNETDISSAIVAASIQQALERRDIVIKQPHDVSMREFQDEKNIVLLGGPWSNPWGQLFEDRLNFRLLPLPSEPAFSLIHNVSPHPGEPVDYTPHKDGNLSVNYVRVAILPNFNSGGHIFVLGATSAEALEAGGSFLLSEDSVPDLLRRFHVRKFSELPPLELVLEVRGFDSVPGRRRIVAERTVQN